MSARSTEGGSWDQSARAAQIEQAAAPKKKMTHAEWFKESDRLSQAYRDSLADIASLAAILVDEPVWSEPKRREVTREQIQKELIKKQELWAARLAHGKVEAEG